MVKPQRVEDIPKRWAGIQLSPSPNPLVLRMLLTPHDGTLPYTEPNLLMIFTHLHEQFVLGGVSFCHLVEIFVLYLFSFVDYSFFFKKKSSKLY
jgi:hypothetical protein